MDNSAIYWVNGNKLYSETFDDIYFNTDNGLKESEYVFVEGNQICQRFQSGQFNRFSLLELGFGTGLNFLATLRAWNANQHNHNGWLDYIAIEKFPLTATAIQKALSVFPEINQELETLLKVFSDNPVGITEYWLSQRVRLTLVAEDVTTALNKITDSWHKLDAIYLDGFAPSKNPDMWQVTHYQKIAKICQPSTTLASFTAAGFVRRGLQQAGFNIFKRKGFGKKREMITGHFSASNKPANLGKPWYAPATNTAIKATLVVGGGIAGITTAYQLLKDTNSKVILLEENTIASGASGNPMALCYPQFDKSLSPTALWSLNAFKGAKQFYAEVDPDNLFHRSTQVELLESAKFNLQRLHQLASVTELQDLIVKRNDKFYLNAIQLEPKRLLDAITKQLHQNPRFQLFEQCRFNRVQRQGDGYQVVTANQTIIDVSHIVYCNSYAVKQQYDWLNIGTDEKWGQVSCFDFSITTGMSGQYYALPIDKDHTLVGANYLKTRPSEAQKSNATHEFMRFLTPTSSTEISELNNRVSCRMTTIDRFPLIGAIADFEFIHTAYNELSKGYPDSHFPECRYITNQYVNVGYGSRGFSHACWGAMQIVKLLSLSNYDSYFSDLVQPARLVIKQLLKGQLPK